MKIYLLAIALLFTLNVHAQRPGGVSGSGNDQDKTALVNPCNENARYLLQNERRDAAGNVRFDTVWFFRETFPADSSTAIDRARQLGLVNVTYYQAPPEAGMIRVSGTRLKNGAVSTHWVFPCDIGLGTVVLDQTQLDNIASQIQPDETRLIQDSILVYRQNGAEIGRDTISGTGGSDPITYTAGENMNLVGNEFSAEVGQTEVDAARNAAQTYADLRANEARQAAIDTAAAIRADLVTPVDIVSETVNYQSEGLNIQALIDYDTLKRSAPLLVIMHQFTGNSEDVERETVDRFVNNGFFVVRPQMRGRTGSQGTRDAGGNEVKDIANAVDFVRKNYSELINAEKAIIYGLSGGGGNVLQSITKHPYTYSAAVNYFGIGNFGNEENSTGWWYTNTSRQAQIEGIIGGNPSEVPAKYAARRSNDAISNFPNPLISFHDRADAVVSVDQTLQIDTVSKDKKLNNPVFISEIGDVYRFLHNEASSVPGIVESENWWTDQVKIYSRPIQPQAGNLKVLGYVRTPIVDVEIGTGEDGTGELFYDFSSSIPTLQITVNQSSRNVKVVFNQLPAGSEVSINGCNYIINGNKEVDIIVEGTQPIGLNVVFSGLYGVTSDTVNNVISYTGGPDSDFGDLAYGQEQLLIGDTTTATFESGFAAIIGINTSAGDPGSARTTPWYNNLEFGVGGAASGTLINVANNFSGVPASGIVNGTQLRIYRTSSQLISEFKNPGGNWQSASSLAMPSTENNYIQLNFREAGKLRNVEHVRNNPLYCTPSASSTVVDWSNIVNVPDSILNPTSTGGGFTPWQQNGTQEIFTDFNRVSVNTQDGTSALNVLSQAVTGREAIAKFQVSDSGNDMLGIANATTTSGELSPGFFGYVTTGRFPLAFQAFTNPGPGASSTNAMFLFQTAITPNETSPNNGSPLQFANRPIAQFNDLGFRALTIERNGDLNGSGHTYPTSQALGAAQDGFAPVYDHSLGDVLYRPISFNGDFGGQKGTNLAEGTASTDAATYGQLLAATGGVGAMSKGSSIANNTDANGDITITHGLGGTPSQVFLTLNQTEAYRLAYHDANATTFKVRVTDTNGAIVANTNVRFAWASYQ